MFGLRERLGDALKALALRRHAKGLELACRIHADVPDALVGDPGRLRQVVVNLVGNAIKFTERGEVVLDVQCESQADGYATLHFAVSDTGIGIPHEKLSALFQAFEQVDASTTRKYGGTGLGLAISTRLVQLMGGRIWVESELGRGSRFHFTARFPVATEAVPENSGAQRGRRSGNAGAGRGRQRHQSADPGRDGPQLGHGARGRGQRAAKPSTRCAGARTTLAVSHRAGRRQHAGRRWLHAGRADPAGREAAATRSSSCSRPAAGRATWPAASTWASPPT